MSFQKSVRNPLFFCFILIHGIFKTNMINMNIHEYEYNIFPKREHET